MPPMEALASGCIVIGYHGGGGREYFKPEFSYPVEIGDFVGFSKAVEDALALFRKDPAAFLQKGQQAALFIRENYSREGEERDVVEFWKKLVGNGSCEP